MTSIQRKLVSPPGFHLTLDREYNVTAFVVHGLDRYDRENSQALREIESLIECWIKRYGLLFCVQNLATDKRMATKSVMDSVLDEACGQRGSEDSSVRETKLMTPSDAGKRLGVSGRTVRRWIAEVGFECPKTEGGMYKITPDILDLLEVRYGNRVQSVSNVQDVRPPEEGQTTITETDPPALPRQCGILSRIGKAVQSIPMRFAAAWVGGGVPRQ